MNGIPGMPTQGGIYLISRPMSSEPVAIPGKQRETSPPEDCAMDSASSGSSFVLQTPIRSFFGPTSPQDQSRLLRTPGEILHKVLCSSGTTDAVGLSRAASTCKELRSYIYENPDNALWRDIHMELYDDPRNAASPLPENTEIDWRNRVQQREFVNRIFREWGEDKYKDIPPLLDMICATLNEMYQDLPAKERRAKATGPENNDSQSEDDFLASPNPANDPLNGPLLESILRSPLFQHIVLNLSLRETGPLLRPLPSRSSNPLRRSTKEVINPNLSRLHCLLAPMFDNDDASHRAHRGYLREVVYSSHNFTEKNEWAPLDDKGRVDWRLVDALSSVMMANAKDVLSMGEESWRLSMKPMSYGIEAVRGWGFRELAPPDLAEGEVWDWAGVEGTWCGSYAFLDYADWISLNEPRIIAIRRSMNQLDLSRYSEAVGDLLHLNLVIDRPHAAGPRGKPRNRDPTETDDLPPLQSNLPTSKLLPPIHFHGTSAQGPGANTYPSAAPSSWVRGVVQLTNDSPPEVRWTLVIRYGGEDRWKVEGVQVGGRSSARGFFGVWTDAMKEEHSPNGPTFYWRK